MSHKVYRTDESHYQCEFCSDNSAELKTEFSSKNDIMLTSYFCFQCFFGGNTHIQSFPVIIDNGTNKCNDCDSLGELKLYFPKLEKTIYLCYTHFCPSAPMISSE